jgi:hypothetical protein
MSGTPINKVKEAGNKLVDLMMPQGTAPSIKIGLVPFRGKVRVWDSADGLPDGCRNADGTVNNSNVNVPDSSCTSTALPRIRELINVKTTIKNGISSMNAPGGTQYTCGTIIPEGIKWGAHVLTQDFPYTQGGPTTQMRKVMILLTDGDNEDGTCGGPNGGSSVNPLTNPDSTYRRNAYFQMGVETCGCSNYGCLDQAMLNEARIAKEDFGIEIFVIRYGDSDSVDIQLMKTVASSTPGTDDHYFNAPSSSDIPKVFEKIGRQLGFRLL